MKECLRCKIRKSLAEFNKSSSPRNQDGYQAHCRTCTAAYYQANKVRHGVKVAARRKRIRHEHTLMMWDYLNGHPCVDCGESDPIVLEFDHVRGQKFMAISAMLWGRFSWTKIVAEIAKCDVRCANCHRRKTARDFKNWKSALVAQTDEASVF